MFSARARNVAPNGQQKIRILVVEDHPIMRQGIRLLVAQEQDLAICGEAATATDALKAAAQLRPDLAIVDLSLRDISGLELLRDMSLRFPRLRILALSMREEPFYAQRVLRAGAMGYITREDGTDKLMEGLRKVLAGEVYVSDKTASKVIGNFVSSRADGRMPLMRNLTDREMEIFELIGRGLTTREIAGRLHVSVKTVGSHREHIKNKLKLANATDLLKHAIGWVQVPMEAAGHDWAAHSESALPG